MIKQKSPSKMSRTAYFLFFASTAAILITLAHTQDFGFPEETGLSKDKQNANVSDNIYTLYIYYSSDTSSASLE